MTRTRAVHPTRITRDRRRPARVSPLLFAAVPLFLAACGDGWSADVEDALGMVASDELIVTVTAAQVRAHGLDGQLRWDTRVDDRDASHDGRARVRPRSVHAGEDLVAVVAHDDRAPDRAWVVIALDARNGDERWRVRFDQTLPRMWVESGSTADFSAAVAVTEDAVVALTPTDEVVVLDATDGRERWRGDIDGPSPLPVASLTVGAGVVVVTDAFGARGFALRGGEVLFTVAERTSHLRPTGVVIDDAVYLVSHLGVRAIGLDGTQGWSAALEDDPARAGALHRQALSPTLVDGALLAAWEREGSAEILVMAYDRRDGTVRWEQQDANIEVGRQRNGYEHGGTLLDLDGRPAVATIDVRVLDPEDGSVTRVVRLDRELERGIVLRGGALVYLDDEVLRRRIVSR